MSAVDKCKIVLVTSCKGGVGKSTAVANIAMSLAKRGKRVLAVDCDFSNRSLDLIFGCENSVLYDICDVLLGRVDIERAVIRDERSENLFFCPAPLETDEDFKPEALREALNSAAEALELDFILIDTPGGAGKPLELAAGAAQSALIVVSHQPTAARAAEKSGILLDRYGVEDQRLIINSFDYDAVESSKRTGVNELIDRTGTQIIGIIPQEYELSLAQEKGILAFQVKTTNMKRVVKAFDNIAARLCGETVPLLGKVCGAKKRRVMLES